MRRPNYVQALAISGSPITTATQNIAYAGFTVTASGGTAPYTFSIASGALPTGLTLGASGVLPGTPTVSGTFASIVIRVTDSTPVTPQTADLAAFTITVAAAASLAVLFGNSVKNQTTASSALTSTATVQVNAAASQVLIAAVFIGGGAADNVTTVTATGFSGTPTTMTRACGAKGNLASRNHNCEIWYLLNPPLGDNIITATRGGILSSRFYVAGLVAYDVDTAAGIITSMATFTNAPGVASHSLPITTGEADLMLITAFSGQENGTATAAAIAGQTAVQDCEPSGQEYYGGLSYKQAGAAGAYQMGADTGASAWRSTIVATIALRAVTHVDVAPTFYAATDGDDANSGLTRVLAVKTPSRIQKFPEQPGKIIYVDGFIRPTAAPAAVTDYVFTLSESGTAALPVRVAAYDATPSAILGDVVYNTGWSAATEAETNSFFASIEKRAMGATMQWGMAATLGGMMLMPAQWSKTGVPTGIHYWDDAAPGSLNFYHYTPSEHGYNDAAKMVSYTSTVSATEGVFTITIKDPDIGTRYGTNTPVGRALCYRGGGSNTAQVVAITGYDQGAGTITAANCSAYPASADGYWAVRFHPRDLVSSGQYAYSQDMTTIFAAFSTGEDRGVVRYNFGLNLDGDYLQYNIGIGRCCATPGLSNQRVVNITGDNSSMTGAIVAQFGISGSPDGININSTSNAATFTTVSILEGWDTSNGWRNFGTGWTVTGAYIRGLSGTYAYAGGNATGTFTSSDFCEQFGIHGNVGTSYQDSLNVTFSYLGVANCVSPITAQLDTKSRRTKSNQYLNNFITGARSLDASLFDNAYAFRLDGGDYSSLFDRNYVANASGGNILTDNPAPNTASNDGMIFRRSVMPCFGVDAISCSGVLIQDIRTTATGGNTEAQWTSVGGATTAPARVTQTTVAFTGALSDADWEIMSRNANGAGGYSAFQLGPNTWDWQFPAYGGTITMVDLILTTTAVFSGYQVNKVIGAIVKARPGSTLSLPAGLTDNNSFALEAGTIRYTAGTLTAAKSITVRETNASASNGPTRDTVINITMRSPFTTFG